MGETILDPCIRKSQCIWTAACKRAWPPYSAAFTKTPAQSTISPRQIYCETATCQSFKHEGVFPTHCQAALWPPTVGRRTESSNAGVHKHMWRNVECPVHWTSQSNSHRTSQVEKANILPFPNICMLPGISPSELGGVTVMLCTRSCLLLSIRNWDWCAWNWEGVFEGGNV